MLQVEHAVLKHSFCVDRLVDEVERIDTAFVDLHQSIYPCVESIVDCIISFLLCLWTVIVWSVYHLNSLDIDI